VRVLTALLLGLALTVIAVAVTLSGYPDVVTSTNAVALEAHLGQTEGPATVCQPGESLPRDASAIRLSLEAPIGPRVTVAVLSGGRLLTSGTRGSGWTAASVTVPVKPLAYTSSGTTVCFHADRSRARLAILGAPTDPAVAARSSTGRTLPGRLRIEYVRAGRASWWSLAGSSARRMGLGRAVAGTWIPMLALLLMLVLTLLMSWLVIREIAADRHASRPSHDASSRTGQLVRRVPLAALACALVACLNAVCWSIITPPFQVPDEPSHFAYVQLLAEDGRLPKSTLADGSPEMERAIQVLKSSEISFLPQSRSLSDVAQQRELERGLAAPLSRQGAGGAGSASSEPPLYYGLQVLPYTLGSGGSLLVRLELMRLLSAVMAAITALFAYLFVREALPGVRWAWTVGGLAVALFPLLGFISGGVNPDALLFVICTMLYYCLARAFRRGLTPRLAILIGVLTAIGFLTKLNFIGFAPGVVLGLALLSVRAARGRAPGTQHGAHAIYRALAIALAIAVSPALLYTLVNLLSRHPVLGFASETLHDTRGSLLHEISYIWQFYLPRLPGMPGYFPGIFTTRQLWFNGLIGLYGWADTLFPGWVYDISLVPGALLAALCIRELIRRRKALRERIPELAIYGLSAVGVVALVAAQSYLSDALDKSEPFWEPRYLLPMLALWGLIAALAARGAGRRWGPTVGTLVVVLLLAHDIFSQLQVIARYYG
jgi:Predicted membrane protein (DUF2142)